MMIRLLLLFLIPGLVFLSGCGKNNIFGKVHKDGSSSSIAALSADAEVALQNKNWNDAAQYYQQILDQNGGNSEALLGYSQAVMGLNGLDMASLIASIIENQDKTTLAPGLNLAEYASPSRVSDGNLIPATLDLDDLHSASQAIIDKLRIIVNGRGDGVIKYDDTDVNLNLAVALLIYAATDLLIYARNNGVITITNDYQVTVNETVLQNKDQAFIDEGIQKINTAVSYVEEAVIYVERVVINLKLKDSSEVAKLKADFQSELETALSEAKQRFEQYRQS